MITVKKIAKECGVSPSTVSNILNGRSNVGEETRQRVLDFVELTGYQPNYFAQSIRNKSSQIISIITEDLTVFGTNPIVESIMAYCDDRNYRTVLMNLRLYSKWRDTWYDEDEIVKATMRPYLQEALSIRVRGIIYVAGHCRLIDYFPPNFNIPVVVAYGLSKNDVYHSIVIDDEKGGYDTARYLISMGHVNTGIVAGVAENLHTANRLLGYQRALFDEGILYNPSLVYYGDWTRESGYHGAKQLLGKGVTAIFCMNDTMAAGVYDCLHERGLRVGNDISVIGYDNMELSDYLYPRLTTSGIELGKIGRKSAEIMIDTLENTDAGRQDVLSIKIPSTMIERESVHHM